MPPKGTPAGEKKERATNFRTYETQARLLSALVASLGSNPRIDYKQIARYYGGGATESAMEHKLRNARAQADLVKRLVDADKDPGDYNLPHATKAEIHKYFGASTPDGLNFQFRAIKKGADALKSAADKGQDTVEAFAAFVKGGSTTTGSVPATPSTTKRARPTPTKTTGSGSRATPASKRQKAIKIEPEPEFDDDEDSPDLDYSELDTTPTKLKPKVHSTPRKNPQLLPHSAWAKPAQKTTGSRPVPIAPAPPRPLAPRPEATPYRLMPIPGIGSSALPNGYTDPATGFGYNVAPPAAVNSATPSATNSPAMGMSTDRRGSAYSSGSYTAASSPATPSLRYADPIPAPANNVVMNNMNMGGQPPPVQGTTEATNGMTTNGTTNMPSFNTNMFASAASPAASTRDVAHTPQTTTSSTTNTMAAAAASTSGMHTSATTTTATSFDETEDYDVLNSFCGFGRPPTTNNGYITVDGASQSYSRTDRREAELAAEVDFGSFEDQEEEDDDGCV